jgi:hypothetical protein
LTIYVGRKEPHRRLPLSQTPADPDADMRAWLRCYVTKHPCHGFRRAWAALRYDERREVNKKQVHRVWRDEGLQVKVVSPRRRVGVSSIPPIGADAANVVWAIDFQFDSTVDGKAVKIASMIDEHTRCSPLNIVERSSTAERLVIELEGRVRGGWRATEGAADGQRSGAVSQALQRLCEGKVPQSQPLEHPVRSLGGDWRLQTRAQSSTPPFGPGLPNAGRVRCGVQAHPHPEGLRDQLNPQLNKPDSNSASTQKRGLAGRASG